MPVVRNPAIPEQIVESKLTEEEAISILLKCGNHFAESLATQYPKLSNKQWFWFWKLAEETKQLEPIKLKTDLEAFIRPIGVLQFAMHYVDEKNDELRSLGKVKFTYEDNRVKIWSGHRKFGEIKGDLFHPSKNCPKILSVQVELFATDPVTFLEFYGKATGHCCICGRLLTNEGSVDRGIGPICAERVGI